MVAGIQAGANAKGPMHSVRAWKRFPAGYHVCLSSPPLTHSLHSCRLNLARCRSNHATPKFTFLHGFLSLFWQHQNELLFKPIQV